MEVRKRERIKAWATGLLLLGVLIQGVRMSQRHLGQRHDFSEDQLFATSPGTRAILNRLEDHLQVKAFVTGDVRSGEMALIKARVEAQLGEYERLANGRMGITYQDPSILSAAAKEASSFGIDPLPVKTAKGGEQNVQLVYLGAVLRYRSRTEVIPWFNPWSLEVDMATAVQRLLQDQRLRLGWCGVPLEQEKSNLGFGRFVGLRERLKRRMDVVEVPVAGLEAGTSIPASIDALLVIRPQDWHPRAAFALDQYLQGGGRAIVCFDAVESSPTGGALHYQLKTDLKPSGLEALLRHWGTPLAPGHVWDVQGVGQRGWLISQLDQNGQPTGKGRVDMIPDPGCPLLSGDQFSRTFPPTSRTSSLQFFWAQPFGKTELPGGLSREDVIMTSEQAYVVDPVVLTRGAVDEIEGHTRGLLAGGSGAQFPLAVVLSGKFPSPFTRGAPTPFDVTLGDRNAKVETTDEPVLSGTQDAQMILVGDSDWLRDPIPVGNAPIWETATPAHMALLDNMVDWLTQEQDLIDVRSKEPKERPLRNFQEEEMRAAGLYGPETSRSSAEMRDRYKRRDQADSRAKRRRWSAMLWPLLWTLASLFLLAGIWNWKERSRA